MPIIESSPNLFEEIIETLAEAADVTSALAVFSGKIDIGVLSATDVTSGTCSAKRRNGIKRATATDVTSATALVGLSIIAPELDTTDVTSVEALFRLNGLLAVDAGTWEATDVTSASGLAGIGRETSATATDVTSATVLIRDADRVSEGELRMTIQIAPPTAGLFHEDAPRLTVDSVVIELESYTLSGPEDGSGWQLSCVLKNFDQRSLVSSGSTFKFELGTNDGSGFTWKTFIDGGLLKQSGANIGISGGVPSDTFNISSAAADADKLNKRPLRDLTIYDGTRVNLDPKDYLPVMDTEGRSYFTEFVNTPGLTFYTLLNLVLVGRCGFTAYRTNIPNFPVRQADFPVGTSFYQGLKALLGPWEPEVYSVDDVLRIEETTTLLPAGFPAPQNVLPARYSAASTGAALSQVECFRVVYSVDELNWDTFADLEETLPVETHGSPLDDNFSQTTITTLTRYYYRDQFPGVPVNQELLREVSSTRNTFDEIGNVTETYEYDSLRRIQSITKVTETLVPIFDGEPEPHLELTEVKRETTENTYGIHPFDSTKQILREVTETVNGLVAVDPDNTYLDKPYKQDIVTAHRAGNFEGENITMETKTISKRTESLYMSATGQYRVRVREEDLLNNLVTLDYTEIRAGDPSTLAKSPVSKQILVFETADGVPSGKERLDFAVGELPLTFAIPLARRKLKRARTTGDANVSLDLPGLELFADRGQARRAVDREGNELGSFLIRGITFAGSRLNTIEQQHSTQVRGVKL